MANPFDQFDATATGNPFDQFDAQSAPSRSVTQPAYNSATDYGGNTLQFATPWKTYDTGWPIGEYGQNVLAGVGGLYKGAGLAARQMYAQAADTIAPRSPTLSGLVTGQNPSRVAALQQEAADKRTTDADLNGTWMGKIGQVAGALPLAFVPGANTYAGAALLGGGMGALQPTVQGESRALNTGVGAGLGMLGKWGGDTVGNWLTERAQQPFTGWRQATANDALAQHIGADSLDANGLSGVANNIKTTFDAVRTPDVSVDMAQQGGTLAQTISTAGRKLNPSSQAEFANNSAISDLMAHMRDGTATAEQLGQISSDLYDQASSIMSTKGADKMVGKALHSVRNQVEDLIQGSIQDPQLASAYGDVRAMYPTWKAMQRPTIFNAASGDINPRNMGSYLQKNDVSGYMLGKNDSPLYEAARWGQKTRIGNAPPVPVFQFGKWLRYHAVNSPVVGAVTGAVSRVGAPISPAVRPVLQTGLPGMAGGTSALVGDLFPYFEQ